MRRFRQLCVPRAQADCLILLDRAAITTKTKVIILNTPHNPVGKMFTRVELEQFAKVAIDNNLLVLSDEVVSPTVRFGRPGGSKLSKRSSSGGRSLAASPFLAFIARSTTVSLSTGTSTSESRPFPVCGRGPSLSDPLEVSAALNYF